MEANRQISTLADRLGLPIHQSPLRFKIRRLMRLAGQEGGGLSIEDWLVDVANQRGATVVFRANTAPAGKLPAPRELSDEELAVALCQLNCADRPQLLRLPAQLISRNQLDNSLLLSIATMERATRVLKAIAEQALAVEPQHPAWRMISQALQGEKDLSEPVIHWSRLAEPVFAPRSARAIGWKLVA